MNEEKLRCVGDFRMAELEWCTAHDNWFHGCNLQAALQAKDAEIAELRSRSEKLVEGMKKAMDSLEGKAENAYTNGVNAHTVLWNYLAANRKPEEAGKPIPAPGKE